jgi:hypothetical protein
MFNHQAQQGFLTLACNTSKCDYLELAYVQAMSIKVVMPTALYAVAVDAETESRITSRQRQVFDYVVQVDKTDWPMSQEPVLFWKTPFKETIKLESDLLFTRNINHWWTALRLRNVVLSTNCRNIEDQVVVDREYRKFWQDNDLPNVYNGMMYFRYTKEAVDFFMLARQLFDNYEYLRDNVLLNCREEKPSTDVIYSLAAKIIGIENCTIPSLDFFNFVHMKPHIQGWAGTTEWCDVAVSEVDPPVIRINNLNQYNPVHYHVKHWITDTIINKYEHAAGIA